MYFTMMRILSPLMMEKSHAVNAEPAHKNRKGVRGHLNMEGIKSYALIHKYIR